MNMISKSLKTNLLLSYDINLQIKNLGRPVPHITIIKKELSLIMINYHDFSWGNEERFRTFAKIGKYLNKLIEDQLCWNFCYE